MIVITAPTGLIGGQVLNNVIENVRANGVDADEQVRVIARDPSALSADVRERVDVVQGSHGDRETVERAFAGADAVFWLVPPNPHAESVEAAYVDFSRPAGQAITSQGVSRVVTISALGRGVALNGGHVTASLAMEDLIASTGVNLRALTMPSFMDNILFQLAPITNKGLFFSPISGDRKLPSVATRDIAVVAADLLLDHTWTGRSSVPLLGPEDLSFNDMSSIMTDVLGAPVRFQQIPGEAYKATFTGFGMSDAMAQAMLDMALAKDNGLDNAVTRTPQATTPTTFRQWCSDVLEPAVLAARDSAEARS